MENLKTKPLYKFHVTISFTIDDQFMLLVPPHRTYINSLIEKNIIESYMVSLQSQACWIVMNATNKAQVRKILAKSPLHKYWTVVVDDVYVYDGTMYRLPQVQLN